MSHVTGYAYQADMFCPACGEDIIADLTAKCYEDTGDTEDWPQAQVGSVEVDCPSHCGNCHELLDCTLTAEGQHYVADALWNRTDGMCREEWSERWPLLAPPHDYDSALSMLRGTLTELWNALHDLERGDSFQARVSLRRYLDTVDPGRATDTEEPDEKAL